MATRKALIKAREERGFSRPELAKKMGASRHYIHSVEVGLRNPSLAMMARWVKALGFGASLDLFVRRHNPRQGPRHPVSNAAE